MDRIDEKRTSQRIQVEVPLFIGHTEAVTRNVSRSGIYFLAKQTFSEGEDLNFSIELSNTLSGQPVRLDCQGKIVRIEQHGKKFGIAAKINNFQHLQ